MATIYVSNSATNGYAVGSDSNSRATAASKATPKLSITSALSVAVDGDTIHVNDGIYTATTYLNIIVPNLTLESETAYGVTVRDDASTQTNQILRLRPTGTGLVVGTLVLDAGGTHLSCIRADVAGTPPVGTFHGTQLIGATSQTVLCQYGALTFDRGYQIVSAGAVAQAVYWEPNGTGQSLSLADGTISMTSSAAAVQAVRVNPVGNNQGASLAVLRNTITIAPSNGTAVVTPIQYFGVTATDVNDNAISLSGAVGTQQVNGINPYSQTGYSISRCFILRNTVDSGMATPMTGHGIVIGDDADSTPAAGRDTIAGVLAVGNTCKNVNHGLLVGWLTGAMVRGNRFDNVVIGEIGKHTVNCEFHAPIVTRLDPSQGGAFRAKGASGDIHANGLHLVSAGYDGTSERVTDSSTGVAYRNNLVASLDGTPITRAVAVDAGSDATFKTNDYWSAGGIGSSAFAYQGTTYSTLAAWIAAQEPTALNVDPQFVDGANGDYRLGAGSALRGAGTWASWRATDYRGRPFKTPPSVGAYSSTARDPVASRRAVA